MNCLLSQHILRESRVPAMFCGLLQTVEMTSLNNFKYKKYLKKT